MSILSTTGQQEAAVERARTVATVLDEAIRIPGTDFRIGLDPILGLLPVSGDLLAAVGSLYIIAGGIRIGVPLRHLLMMVLLVVADTAIGSIPVLGTVFDAFIKVNKRNVAVLDSHAEGPAA